MSDRQPLFVTKAYLPPQEEFLRHVDAIFASRILTNQGELVRDLERRLAAFLGITHVLSCANGTLALMLALRLAGLSGKKIRGGPRSLDRRQRFISLPFPLSGCLYTGWNPLQPCLQYS
jgi:hypothetical protein